MRLNSLVAVVLLLGTWQAPVQAAEYQLDPAHSFVEFRVQHLGYSWLYGRFNDVSGSYSYDPENPEATEINVEVKTASVDTNHAKRDKHLRSEDFLHVDEFPTARFEGTGYTGTAEKGVMEGRLTLHGVTRAVSIEVEKLGEGEDPWGGYRSGFIGTMTIDRGDFGIDYPDLRPTSWQIHFELGIEGVRQ